MKVLSLLGLILLVIAAFFYFALRTKVADVSGYKPFSDLIGKTLVLQRNAVVAHNLEEFQKEFPLFLDEENTRLFEGVKQVAVLPKGTELTITKAKFYKNAVSGFTTCAVMGKVFVQELNKEVDFEYSWGNQAVLLGDDVPPYWTFPAALWQTESDSVKYELPVL